MPFMGFRQFLRVVGASRNQRYALQRLKGRQKLDPIVNLHWPNLGDPRFRHRCQICRLTNLGPWLLSISEPDLRGGNLMSLRPINASHTWQIEGHWKDFLDRAWPFDPIESFWSLWSSGVSVHLEGLRKSCCRFARRGSKERWEPHSRPQFLPAKNNHLGWGNLVRNWHEHVEICLVFLSGQTSKNMLLNDHHENVLRLISYLWLFNLFRGSLRHGLYPLRIQRTKAGFLRLSSCDFKKLLIWSRRDCLLIFEQLIRFYTRT